MTRGGQAKTRDVSERRCVVTNETQPKSGLIRFVLGPDDIVVPDLNEKLPGRGIWVTAEQDVLKKAIAKKAFARGAKKAVNVPDDLFEQVHSGLTRRVTDGIALARKAGLAIAGYEKVKGWLETGEAVVLMQASDGSERGKTKLRIHPEEGEYIACLTASELGLAFGRERVIHGALAAGGLTKRVVEDAAKLKGVRKTDGEIIPGKGTKS